jgi:hypothetical protein
MTLTAARCDYSRIHADGVKHDFRRSRHDISIGLELLRGSSGVRRTDINMIQRGHFEQRRGRSRSTAHC